MAWKVSDRTVSLQGTETTLPPNSAGLVDVPGRRRLCAAHDATVLLMQGSAMFRECDPRLPAEPECLFDPVNGCPQIVPGRRVENCRRQYNRC